MTPHVPPTLGPYRLVAPLGRGAMGEVYRARDTRLHRDVAVKLLPREFLADPDRLNRFQSEARAAAATNHPNLLSVYDVGAQDGLPYIVSELLSGETLRSRLRHGPLPLDQAIAYARQLASGLAAAHAAGVVHRDLKPENVFVTADDRVKILDFGLAKIAAPAAEGTDSSTTTRWLTEPGLVMGTAPYMSPEQVRGDPVDHRADLFAFGAVLFEMLTGRVAFAAPTPVEAMTAVLTVDPLAAAGALGQQPPALVRVVRHCLEKDPGARFQSAGDVAFGLDVLSDAPAAGRMSSAAAGHTRRPAWLVLLACTVLAVLTAAALLTSPWRSTAAGTGAPVAGTPVLALPFANLSGPDSEYFTDGITDSLTTDLARVDGLTVFARTAAFRYKAREVDPRTVGRELGARYVVQGSVQRSGDRVRVNAHVVDVASGRHVWADRFEERVPDLFVLQDALARRVVEALRPDAPMTRRASTARPTASPEAYDAYLQGLYHTHRPGLDGESRFEKAIAWLERATALDPDFALAQAALGSVYTQQYFYVDADRQWERKAFVAIERALARDPNLAEAYLARGQLAWSLPNGFPHEQAVADLKKAIALSPGLAEAHRELGKVYLHIGLLEASIAANTQAIRLDPGDAVARGRRQMAYLYGRDCATALDLADSDGLRGGRSRAAALTCLGRDQEALDEIASLPRPTENDTSVRIVILARAGRHAEARAEIARLRVQADNVNGLSDLHHIQYNIGAAYALMGETRQAVWWLRKAMQEGLPCYPLFARDPDLAGLRQDPDFAAMLQQLERQHERFRAQA